MAISATLDYTCCLIEYLQAIPSSAQYITTTYASGPHHPLPKDGTQNEIPSCTYDLKKNNTPASSIGAQCIPDVGGVNNASPISLVCLSCKDKGEAMRIGSV